MSPKQLLELSASLWSKLIWKDGIDVRCLLLFLVSLLYATLLHLSAV